MDDLTLQKIEISGPILASLIQQVSSSPADVDGLLFGHVTQLTPATLTDDSTSGSPSATIATVSSFLCSGFPRSFSDSLTNHADTLKLAPQGSHLIGWFSGRRRSRLQPSMRDFNVTASLSSDPKFSFSVLNSALLFAPRVFILLTTPPAADNVAIHTHEYRAYQFRTASETFEPKSISVINIGPGFRGHYGNFSPNSSFPALICELRGSSIMNEDVAEETLNVMKQVSMDQKELDSMVEGFQIADLRRLIGPEASSYTVGLEEMYGKMLAKISSLARSVEKSSARVLELENNNSKLRAEIVGIKKAADA